MAKQRDLPVSPLPDGHMWPPHLPRHHQTFPGPRTPAGGTARQCCSVGSKQRISNHHSLFHLAAYSCSSGKTVGTASTGRACSGVPESATRATELMDASSTNSLQRRANTVPMPMQQQQSFDATSGRLICNRSTDQDMMQAATCWWSGAGGVPRPPPASATGCGAARRPPPPPSRTSSAARETGHAPVEDHRAVCT
jgi:hypothetical protein